MDRTFERGHEILKVSANRVEDRILLSTEDGQKEFHWEELNPGEYLLKTNGHQHRLVVARKGKDRWIWVDGHIHVLKVVTGRPRKRSEDEGSLAAPMNGIVLKVLVAEGDAVKKKQPLMMLEAMKMQYEIVAPKDGVVKRLACKEGDQVEGGKALVELGD